MKGLLFVAFIVFLMIVFAATFVWASEHQKVRAEETSPAPTPLAAYLFTPILPAPSLLPVYPAPLAWSPPVLPQPTFPGPTEPPKPKTRPKPQPAPPRPNLTGSSLKGVATWYCLPSWPSKCMTVHPNPRGMYAAAGPALRVALGGNAGSRCPCPWRNRLVKVTNLVNHLFVWVKLADWCACGGGHTIDLYSGPFAILARHPFSSPGGGLEVKISW